MISQIAILVGILAALVAGGAQAIAHRYAQRQRWHPIARYTCGVTVIGAAFAVPLFVALPVESAAALWELETVNLLIVHFAQRPNVVKRLGAIRRRLLDAKANAIAERESAARHI